MSNIFWKRFNHCLSSLKCLPDITPSPPSPSKQDQNQFSPTSTSLLFKNYKSVYDLSSEFSTSKSLTVSTTDDYFSSSAYSDTDSDTISPPDFATIFASQRFFFSSPGRSNSIIESQESTRADTQETRLNGGGVAVKKYSPDPYSDFRCSMLEMIEARNLSDVMADWDFLHELLLCYLTLNPKDTHKFIISAFADILISLLSSQDSDCHRNFEGRRR
ncbi:Transcription repressor like [Melia azedarach]|uniref:Transcription repressor like n=1 Tax=Melia azedarach TaxID=155640 RepID=A0ACC1YGG9_MELAZ|nr:Transcription repressor like [Melia azedarach]